MSDGTRPSYSAGTSQRRGPGVTAYTRMPGKRLAAPYPVRFARPGGVKFVAIGSATRGAGYGPHSPRSGTARLDPTAAVHFHRWQCRPMPPKPSFREAPRTGQVAATTALRIGRWTSKTLYREFSVCTAGGDGRIMVLGKPTGRPTSLPLSRPSRNQTG